MRRMTQDNMDEWQPDVENLMALEAEIPVLQAVTEFAARAERARWFAELGEPFDAATTQIVRSYLDVLGFPDADAIAVPSRSSTQDAGNNPTVSALSTR